MRIFIAAAILGIAVILGNLHPPPPPTPLPHELKEFSRAVPGWKARGTLQLDRDVIDVLGLSDYLLREYVDQTGRNVWLYVAYYAQGPAFHSPKLCLPGSGWQPIEAERLVLPVASAPGGVPVNRYVVQKGNKRELLLYWYQSQGRAMAGDLEAKFFLFDSALRRHRKDSALVRVSSPLFGSQAETLSLHAGFVQNLYPLLEKFLPR